MRVKIAESTGSPVPQFVIYAENTTERVVLANFSKYAAKAEYLFKFHGATYECDYPGAKAFNFGVVPYNNVFNRTPTAASFLGRCLAWAGNWLIKLSERAG